MAIFLTILPSTTQTSYPMSTHKSGANKKMRSLLLLLSLALASATPCDTTTTCTTSCVTNNCASVFGTGLGRRSVGKLCNQGISNPNGASGMSCGNPPSNPSLDYSNKLAYWCGPGKITANCGTVTVEGVANTQLCQGSACLLVDGVFVCKYLLSVLYILNTYTN